MIRPALCSVLLPKHLARQLRFFATGSDRQKSVADKIAAKRAESLVGGGLKRIAAQHAKVEMHE